MDLFRKKVVVYVTPTTAWAGDFRRPNPHLHEVEWRGNAPLLFKNIAKVFGKTQFT